MLLSKFESICRMDEEFEDEKQLEISIVIGDEVFMEINLIGDEELI